MDRHTDRENVYVREYMFILHMPNIHRFLKTSVAVSCVRARGGSVYSPRQERRHSLAAIG
jgi:hypothetical protein